MQLMPAAFLGHGSPVNTLEDNRYTRSWKALGASVPEPRAVLVVSAHWYTIPLLYLAGFAQQAGRTAKILVDGYALGSVSMTSYTLDCDCPVTSGGEPTSDPLPDPNVPPEQSNI